MNNKYHLIRKIYLYTFSLVGLVLVVIGGVRLVGLGLKSFAALFISLANGQKR